MKIMSVNSGSSSVKIQLFEMPSEAVLAKLSFERIGFEKSYLKLTIGENTRNIDLFDNATHNDAIDFSLKILKEEKIINSIEDISGVGHRVVQGSDFFNKSVVIDNDVKSKIKSLFEMAPLHNPANYAGIKAFEKINNKLIQVASFDTAFHQTMPQTSYTFPINKEFSNDHKIRRFGAHGISVNYIVNRYAQLKGISKNEVNAVVAHLGSGASITSVIEGKTYETSMGLTPLGGIMMGTRSGDLDPSVVLKLVELNNNDVNKVNELLNKKSGILGVSGISNDMRDILDNIDSNPQAKLTYDLFIKRCVDYIGSYSMYHSNLNAIILTAGIGEYSPPVPVSIANYCKNLGVELKPDFEQFEDYRVYSSKDSKIDFLVINTNEELMIAQDTYNILKNK